MRSQSLHNSTKRLYDFFYRDVTAFHEVPLNPPPPTPHSPSSFPSLNITKNAETHPPPLHDVIIEQLLLKPFHLSKLDFSIRRKKYSKNEAFCEHQRATVSERISLFSFFKDVRINLL